MSSSSSATAALQTFDDVLATTPGMRPRPGQRDMAALVAQTLAQARLGKEEGAKTPPAACIAVIQAGTGVGKSLAYATPAIALALQRNTRVIISTATVALQEQLVHKDLPALAAQMPQAFRYALAKGRGRFICKLKLDRLASTGSDASEDEPMLFSDLPPLPALEGSSNQHRRPPPVALQQARMAFYTAMAQALASGQWDGDRDSLPSPPEPELWASVAAQGHSCTGRHCPAFDNCSYYERRKTLVAAQVLVVNHDLLLSSLQAKLLPDLDNCLLVFDEAHHLPQTALSQFASQADLSRLQWLERLSSHALRVGQLLQTSEIADLPQHSSALRQHLHEWANMAQALLQSQGKSAGTGTGANTPQQYTLPSGALPPGWQDCLEQVLSHAQAYLDVLRALAQALRNALKEQPEEAQRLSLLYGQLGSHSTHLEAVYTTCQLWLQALPASSPDPASDSSNGSNNGSGNPDNSGNSAAPAAPVPIAKWLSHSSDGTYSVIHAHASPVLPGTSLRQRLWSQVRGAVLTSATLRSCGNFDFFLHEVGLSEAQTYAQAQVQTLAVDSPFDYNRQGQLIAHHTRSDPRHAASFTPEMVYALTQDLAQVQSGALVLFTSREQMRQAVDALPSHLRGQVLVQTAMSRGALLSQHRQRVQQGLVSIIFGMQSFGEGLDLPGALCTALFITKLPFAPPDDPVGQTRAQWLRTHGRNAFIDLVVPATAIRMAQWVGRAIRSEEDQASVYCYDKRLLQTSYGQQILKSLPDFTLKKRFA
ncbi:MAG: ATP-dependent DNA helicase DinG [Comamonas sp.]|nr:ATP-dependent DNA helicase DinG [Comamonas sp.]